MAWSTRFLTTCSMNMEVSMENSCDAVGVCLYVAGVNLALDRLKSIFILS